MDSLITVKNNNLTNLKGPPLYIYYNYKLSIRKRTQFGNFTPHSKIAIILNFEILINSETMKIRVNRPSVLFYYMFICPKNAANKIYVYDLTFFGYRQMWVGYLAFFHHSCHIRRPVINIYHLVLICIMSVVGWSRRRGELL